MKVKICPKYGNEEFIDEHCFAKYVGRTYIMIVKEFILRILMVLMILVKYIITQVMPDTAKLVRLKQDFL